MIAFDAIRRRFAALALPAGVLAALGMALALLAGPAPSARADIIPPVVVNPVGRAHYPIDANAACRQQVPNTPGVEAYALHYFTDPFSWVCGAPVSYTSSSEVSIGVSKGGEGTSATATFTDSNGVTYRVVKGVNFDEWCAAAHPGTVSELTGSTAGSWDCIQALA